MPTGNLDFVEDCEIIPGILTDHLFVVLKIKFIKAIQGPGYWKFNNSLLKDHSFLEQMNAHINLTAKQSSHLDSIMQWEIMHNQMVNFCKDYAKYKASMRRDELKEVESKIKMLMKKLNMINLSSDNAVKLFDKVNTKLDFWLDKHQKILNHNTQGQILRTKTSWYEHGEKNTKYFLRLEKGKA